MPGRKRLLGIFLTFFVVLILTSPLLLFLEKELIHAYRNHGGMVRKNTNCQYQPTCSRYALGVLETRGFWKGNYHISKRFLMCSPIGWSIRKINGQPEEPRKAAPGDVWHPPQEHENQGVVPN